MTVEKIKVLQVGLGSVGQGIYDLISLRPSIKTVAAVDTNPDLQGRDLGELAVGSKNGVLIQDNIDTALKNCDPDVALVSTVSDLAELLPTLESLVDWGIPVISTCEQLCFSWKTQPGLSEKIDHLAKSNHVAVLGTGVNPGFLMDTLPSVLTTLNNRVDRIEVFRVQNASSRRLPFQLKIGSGLSPVAFEERRGEGKIGHVGLAESVHLIAHRLRWTVLNYKEDLIPIFAEDDLSIGELKVKAGDVCGVEQSATANCDGGREIQLTFKAELELDESFDEIRISGDQNITARISGGVNGDKGTASVVLNSIPALLSAEPGLRHMGEITSTNYFL